MKWPDDTPTTGTVIQEIEAYKVRGISVTTIPISQLQRWQDCVIYCAALLDPDNQPLTKEDLARMRPKIRS